MLVIKSQAPLRLQDQARLYSCSMPLKDLLKTARKSLVPPMTQEQLAERMGVTKQAVSNWERGKDRPDVDKLLDLARTLRIPPESLLGETDAEREVHKNIKYLRDELDTSAERIVRKAAEDTLGQSSSAPALAMPLPPMRGPSELRPEATRSGRADFKIFGTAEGGPGAVILSSDPIESREWPVNLVGVNGAYGVLITNDSMVPAFRPGDIALVNPHLPARPDDEVILQRDDHGTIHGMVKTLVRQSATEYRLKQWNPEKEFTRAKKEWPTCHLVVGKFRR